MSPNRMKESGTAKPDQPTTMTAQFFSHVTVRDAISRRMRVSRDIEVLAADHAARDG